MKVGWLVLAGSVACGASPARQPVAVSEVPAASPTGLALSWGHTGAPARVVLRGEREQAAAGVLAVLRAIAARDIPAAVAPFDDTIPVTVDGAETLSRTQLADELRRVLPTADLDAFANALPQLAVNALSVADARRTITEPISRAARDTDWWVDWSSAAPMLPVQLGRVFIVRVTEGQPRVIALQRPRTPH